MKKYTNNRYLIPGGDVGADSNRNEGNWTDATSTTSNGATTTESSESAIAIRSGQPTDDDQTTNNNKNKTPSSPCFWAFHFLITITMCVFFFVSAADFDYGIQFLLFSVYQSLVPIASLYWIVSLCWSRHCCDDVDDGTTSTPTTTKLWSRLFFWNAAILSIVYIVVESLWSSWDDRSFLVAAVIGLFSSLYHWFVVERCFKHDDNGTTTSVDRRDGC